MHTMHLLPTVAIQSNLELKTQPKQFLGSLVLVIALTAAGLNAGSSMAQCSAIASLIDLHAVYKQACLLCYSPRNNKGGSIIVPLTSCLIGLDQSVLQIKTKL